MIASKNISHRLLGTVSRFIPAKKDRASSLENLCVFYFSHHGTQTSTQTHSPRKVKKNTLSVICLGARVMFLL